MTNVVLMFVFALLSSLGVSVHLYGWAVYNTLIAIYFGTKAIVDYAKEKSDAD